MIKDITEKINNHSGAEGAELKSDDLEKVTGGGVYVRPPYVSDRPDAPQGGDIYGPDNMRDPNFHN